jgi:tetratricopeptide (TPR) repeat protein
VRQRRWQVPPPITREPGGRLPALPILEEFPGETGVLLWQSLRSVLAWEKAKKAQRERLFLPAAAEERRADLLAAALPAELEEPVTVLAGVLDGCVTAKKLAVSCREISDWAFGLERTGTAFHFMQAAALAVDSDARLAYEAGRLARRRAEYDVAESWFDEAASRALETRDWDSYARVFLGMGNVHLQRGNYPRAKNFHLKAFRIGERHGLREIQGLASHDLFTIALAKGEKSEVEGLAASALHFYGAGHAALPGLAYDLAVFEGEMGNFASSRALLRAVLPHLQRRRARLLALGALADMSAALGDRNGFRSAWEEVWTAVGEPGGSVEADASALAWLAEGAVRLQDWARATQAAERALEIAEERQENEDLFRAEAALKAAAAGMRTVSRVRPARPEPASERADRITDDFLAALAAVEISV